MDWHGVLSKRGYIDGDIAVISLDYMANLLLSTMDGVRRVSGKLDTMPPKIASEIVSCARERRQRPFPSLVVWEDIHVIYRRARTGGPWSS
jgi:hypothetical protein